MTMLILCRLLVIFRLNNAKIEESKKLKRERKRESKRDRRAGK